MDLQELTPASRRYELRFDSLFVPGRALSFPCDAGGRVDLNVLPARACQNYLRARSLIGRDFASPRLSAVSRL